MAMKVVSESTRHNTLLSAVSKLDIQSDQMESEGDDIPFPRERLSDKTLNLLEETSAKIA